MSHFEIQGGTDRGLVRKNNEDSIVYCQFDDANAALAAVADGVGGYEGGEVASKLAVDTLEQMISIDVLQRENTGGFTEQWLENQLVHALVNINQQVIDQQSQDQLLSSMSTTLVALLFKDNQFTLANLGDSRCYRIRNREIQLLSKDHTVAQQMLDNGAISQAQYMQSPYHHVLSKGIGLENVITPAMYSSMWVAGDVFLLCSDGLTNTLSDDEILAVVSGASDLQGCVDELITRANDAGGGDNISVVLVRCLG
ncbi:MAG: protein phosphatase 2C domain-containing protein [Gammaproteobacteria bacterium]|nr:protein phosphatase 2C domain-containing protein [Gammaproteobacteria bacterium]